MSVPDYTITFDIETTSVINIINKTLDAYLYCTYEFTTDNVWYVNINNISFGSIFNIIIESNKIYFHYIQYNEIILYQLYLWIFCTIKNYDNDQNYIVDKYLEYDIIISDTTALFDIACLTINPFLHSKLIKLDYIYIYYVLMISQNYLSNDFKIYPVVALYNFSIINDINNYFDIKDKENLINYITNIKDISKNYNTWKYVCYNLLEKIEVI
jgi:hypothetical protein